jgi:DNA (cytosine-5)-methyltransferase 1
MFNLVSLFSGMGGLDLGLESAGFKTKLCVENDKNCIKTLNLNRPKWKIAEPSDIFLLHAADARKQAGLKRGELDLLAGGPPCQPFSKASYWRRGDSLRLKDPRAQTLTSYMELVEEFLPKVILLENVEGIKFDKKDEGLTLLKKRFEEINKRHKTKYAPYIWSVNAADYGVPQLRKRVLVIASRQGKTFVPPQPTHGSLENPYITAWDALGDVKNDVKEDLKPKGSWTDLLPSIPEGENYLWHTNRGGGKPLFGYRTRYWSFLLKLSKNKPSWTIPAQPGPSIGPFHWDNRLLSVRELARLQTFPDDFKLIGSRQVVQKQIGNAVPPLLGEIIGREIAAQLLGKKRSKKSLKFLKKRSSIQSSTKRVKRIIPSKYSSKVGKYAPHPGTGKGPGAIARQTLETV